MPQVLPYNRELAVEYAQKWALRRNPNYFNFDKVGGDCTNFISQSLFDGRCIMNHDKLSGWYYSDSDSKSPSWTGVNFLYNFLISNKMLGPFATEVQPDALEIGDIVQINFEDDTIYNHTLIITSLKYPINYNNIIICSHSRDRLNEPLSNIHFKKARFLKILGSYK